jgi:hypothetical protein
MSLCTPTMNENGGVSLGTFFSRDSSFPRTRESRFVSASLSLDTRFRGYDGNAVVYFGSPVLHSIVHPRTVLSKEVTKVTKVKTKGIEMTIVTWFGWPKHGWRTWCEKCLAYPAWLMCCWPCAANPAGSRVRMSVSALKLRGTEIKEFLLME